MRVTEAGENYLEAILVLNKRLEFIHAADICAELGFSRPTVSEMVKQLRNGGYITVDGDNHIRLTESGLKIAESVYERHDILCKVLMSIGVDRDTAYEDACKIEHDLSEQSFACIKAVYENRLKKGE